MDQNATKIIYLGFILPALFAITLVTEGLWKAFKHTEDKTVEGYFNIVMGILILLGVTVLYLFLFRK